MGGVLQAVQAGARLVWVFVRLRETLRNDQELSARLQRLENGCDANFKVVFKAIRELMDAPVSPERRKIGFASGQF